MYSQVTSCFASQRFMSVLGTLFAFSETVLKELLAYATGLKAQYLMNLSTLRIINNFSIDDILTITVSGLPPICRRTDLEAHGNHM